ncbi:hypothetical protein Poly59_40700 [Rubripirellula reticaptiva]|uniref:Uncharacterized protein n=1 Tax=Rubripirellula reticaptiva TaxID=2528013 RepID=A0A5C6ELT9_9BACT|nr:hypothetical protein Poly59_40700 [Rubripirellula reticaptiva]
MNEPDLFEKMSARERWELVLPPWAVNWIVGPFPSEIGWLPFLLKWYALIRVFWYFIDEMEIPLEVHHLLIASGIAWLLLDIHERWHRD